MKKTHIAMIIAIAAVSAFLISSVVNASQSVAFKAAMEKPGKEFKVTGTFDHGHEIVRNPKVNADLTEFYMIDKDGHSQKVILHSDKGEPMGLKNSEAINLHGSFNEKGEFHANDIQMKCPSKYNQDKYELKVEEQ